jgi:hypothetical protein
MLTPDQEKYILAHAYVPEHTVGLMTSLSGGEGFLVDDFFFCRRDDWIVFVGYPLQQEFVLDKFETILILPAYLLLRRKFHPGSAQFAGKKTAIIITFWTPVLPSLAMRYSAI